MSYNNYHGGGGGYGGGYGRGYGHKINEDDVPESKHAIFIRGLPADVTFDDIKEFFEDKIGPCSFDFQKVNQDRNLLFVAVRFESRESAKEAYTKYREENVLGYRCEVTWFRDIKRFISYQSANGGMNRYQQNRGRAGGRFDRGGGRNDRRRRYSDERSRSRSFSDSDRSRSRSKSKSRSRSRTHSLSDGERRSTSRDTADRKKDDHKRKRNKDRKRSSKGGRDRKRSRRSESRSSASNRSGSDSDGGKAPSKKKVSAPQRAASVVSSAPSSPLHLVPPPAAPLIGPVVPVQDDNKPLRRFILPPEDPAITKWRLEQLKKEREDMEARRKRFRITITNKPTAPVESTAFKMQLDSDEPPKRIIRPVRTPTPVEEEKKEDSLEPMELEEAEPVETEKPKDPVVIDATEKGGWRTYNDDGTVTHLTQSRSSGPPSDVNDMAPDAPPVAEATFINKVVHHPSSSVTMRPAADPVDGLIKSELIPARMGIIPPKKSAFPVAGKSPAPPPPRAVGVATPRSSRFPQAAKLVGELKFVQDRVMQSITSEAIGTLRLSLVNDNGGLDSLEKMEERERMLTSLNDASSMRFKMKRAQLEQAYNNDVETFGVVTRSLLSKDPSLEGQLKTALLQSMEDLEKQLLSKIDAQLEMITGVYQ